MTYPTNAVSAAGHSAWYSYAMVVQNTAGFGLKTIGSFSKFSPSSTRTVERVREVLNTSGAGVIDMVWGGTDTKVSLEYTQLFQADIFEALGFNVYCLEDMKFAFDIVESFAPPGAAAGSGHVLTYEMCVASSWGKDLDSGGTKVIETMEVEVGRVRGTRL